MSDFNTVVESLQACFDLQNMRKKQSQIRFGNKGSLVFYVEAERYFCFESGLGGDLISYLTNEQGHDFKSASAFLDGLGYQTPYQRANPMRKNTVDNVQAHSTYQQYTNSIQLESAEAHQYLQTKKITDDELALLPFALTVGKYNDSNGTHDCLYNPAYKEGCIVGIEAIFYYGGEKQIRKSGGKFVQTIRKGSDKVYALAEGLTNTLRISQCVPEKMTVVNCFNKSTLIEEAIKLTNQGATVTIFADADLKNDDKIAGVKRIVYPPEDFKDFDDYFLCNGKDALLELFDLDEVQIMSSLIDFWDKRQNLDWIVNDFIARTHTAIIASAFGQGKTMLMIDLAMSVVFKNQWMGRAIPNPLRVAFLCGEGATGFSERTKAWVDKNLGTDDDWQDKLGAGGYFSMNTVNFALAHQDEHFNMLIEWLDDLYYRGCSPDLLFIDTYNNHFLGNENSSEDVKKFTDLLNLIADKYNLAIIIASHAGKGEQIGDYVTRGSTALQDNCNNAFKVTKSADEMSATLTCHKFKDGSKLMPQQFNFVQHGGSSVIEYVGVKKDEPKPLTATQLQIYDLLIKLTDKQREHASTETPSVDISDLFTACIENNVCIKGGKYLRRDRVNECLQVMVDRGDIVRNDEYLTVVIK